MSQNSNEGCVHFSGNSDFDPGEKCMHPSSLLFDTWHAALVLRTCMQVPVCSRHRLQDRAQRLAGMWDTLVMGSIFSGQPMLTCRGRNSSQRVSVFLH